MTAGFVLLSALPRLNRAVPPLIGALVIGAIAIWLLGAFQAPAEALFGVARPSFYAPRFSWPALVELVPPLVITVLAVQNAQGIAILRANGHNPPTNAIAVACGAGAVVTGLVGAVSTAGIGDGRPIALIVDAAQARDGRDLVDPRLEDVDAEVRLPRTDAEARTDVRYFDAQGYQVVVAGPLAEAAADSTGVPARQVQDLDAGLSAIGG